MANDAQSNRWLIEENSFVSPPIPTQNISSASNISANGETFTFTVPGTPISLDLSNFHGLLNQGELDLCVIEGFASIFNIVVAKGSDVDLPLNSWSSRYGNVVINVDDFAPPSFRMTYGVVATMLRGIALFASMHGFVEMQVEVYNKQKGHLGTGEVGRILPNRS